jgi:phage FluMu protein Com
MNDQASNGTTSDGSPPSPAAHGSAATVSSSRMVRCFKAETVRCSKCDLLPVEVTFMSPLGVTHHRFECPQCDDPTMRWEWSHAKAADAWNAKHKPPNAQAQERREGTL